MHLLASVLRALSIVGSAALLFAQTSEVSSIPKGSQISVRTLDPIQSKQGEVGQSYRCTLDQPITANGRQLAAKGADCVLQIVEMKSAGKLKGSNESKLIVSQIRMDGNLVGDQHGTCHYLGKRQGQINGSSYRTRSGVVVQ
jgi:hypothetical protein